MSSTPPSGTAQDYTANAYGQTVTAPGGVSYGYDGLGRLATRTTSTGTSDFAYSGTGDTVASDGTTSYSYDPGGDLVTVQSPGGTAEAALTDVHGDVIGLFSPAAATTTLAASAAYSPYGTVTVRSGSMPSLGYQGQYTDPSTGDTDMSARWYSPSTSTFTTNDTLTGSPAPDTIDASHYSYANSNPLTAEDPSGHFAVPDGGVAPQTYTPLQITEPFAPAEPDYAMDFGADDEVDLFDPYALLFAAIMLTPQWMNFGIRGDGCSNQAAAIVSCETVNPGDLNQAIDAGPGHVNWGIIGPGFINWGISSVSLFLNYFGFLPPPPPPQDCYAGPDPSCSPPPAPRSLRDGQHITTHAADTVNPAVIPHRDTIVEATPTLQQLLDQMHLQTAGADTDPGVNGASGQNASGDEGQAQGSIVTIGVPFPPTAPSPVSSGGGNGNGSPSASGGPGKTRIVSRAHADKATARISKSAQRQKQAAKFDSPGSGGGGNGPLLTLNGCSEDDYPGGFPYNPYNPAGEQTALGEAADSVSTSAKVIQQSLSHDANTGTALVGVNPNITPTVPVGLDLAAVTFALVTGSYALAKFIQRNRNGGNGGCR